MQWFELDVLNALPFDKQLECFNDKLISISNSLKSFFHAFFLLKRGR